MRFTQSRHEGHGESMSGGVTITTWVLEDRIRQLTEIVIELDEMLEGSWYLPNRQGAHRWTTNEAAMQFTNIYRTRLSEAEQTLRELRERVEGMAGDLRATAESFGLLEGDIANQLDDLDTMLADVPERRVPVGGGYTPIAV